MQGPAPGELEPWGGLGRGGLGCSLEIQEGNKDREGKECRELKSVGMRTAYHNSALIISHTENTASSAGWSTVLLGHLLQVKTLRAGQMLCCSQGEWCDVAHGKCHIQRLRRPFH